MHKNNNEEFGSFLFLFFAPLVLFFILLNFLSNRRTHCPSEISMKPKLLLISNFHADFLPSPVPNRGNHNDEF